MVAKTCPASNIKKVVHQLRVPCSRHGEKELDRNRVPRRVSMNMLRKVFSDILVQVRQVMEVENVDMWGPVFFTTEGQVSGSSIEIILKLLLEPLVDQFLASLFGPRLAKEPPAGGSFLDIALIIGEDGRNFVLAARLAFPFLNHADLGWVWARFQK